MKTLFKTVLTAAALATSFGASAQVTYKLGGQSDFTFELTAPGFITSDTSFAASSLTQCTSLLRTCTRVSFVVDAFANGHTATDLNWQAAVVETSAGTDYFYFPEPAFTTAGLHLEASTGGGSSLSVSAVPEPATFALMALGALVVGAVAKRRGA